MAYNSEELYTSAIRSPEDVPQRKTVFDLPSTRGGAPEWSLPSEQSVTAMIGRYPQPPRVPDVPAQAPNASQRTETSAVGAKTPLRPEQELLPNYLRNEQTGATYRFRSQQPSAVSGEYIPAERAIAQRPSPAREALSEYEDILSTFGGTGPNSALAADILTRRVLGKAAGIRQERGAAERAAAAEAGATERARLGEKGALELARMSKSPTEESEARAALLRAQLASTQDREAIEQKLADPKLTGPARDRWLRLYEMKYGSKGDKSTAAADIYNKLVSAGMDETEARQRAGFANGGAIEGYAGGGAISSPVTQTQQVNPAIAQYGQYLTAAASAGVPPVPFNQYMNLIQSTRGAMQETPTQFADGGDVSALRRPIEGPGTGRSDSIPAVIDGNRPAALSDGEFVIPAHVVRAKGTEFFEKLIGQYDQGQK